MSIFYVDPVNGSTTADGTTFANRVKWPALVSGAYGFYGDEIRVIGNPITSVGNGAVRKMYQVEGYSSGRTCDITTYSDGTKTKVTCTAGYFKVGDVVVLANSSMTDDRNVNGYWRVEQRIDENNFHIDHISTTAGNEYGKQIHDAPCFYLNSAVTQDIFAGDDTTFSNWTAVSGVSTNKENQYWSAWSTDTKSGAGGQTQRVTIPTNQATGLCAYYALPSTLDLSSYQQISLRARSNGITRNDSSANSSSDIHFSLRLCTDTAGQTSVHTIPLDFRKVHNRFWLNLCVDLGVNLNTSIKSIAIYKDYAQPDTEDIIFGNIIACKASSAADSLTHTSIIGLNTTADPYWYKIKYISGRKVILDRISHFDQDPSYIFSYYAQNPYAYFSECKSNVAIYKMQPFTLDPANASTQASNAAFYDFGNEFSGVSHFFYGNGGGQSYPMKVTGGWTAANGTATDMTHRTSLSCFDLVRGKGYVSLGGNQIFENFAFINGHEGLRANGAYYSAVKNIHCIGCTNGTWTGSPYINSTYLYYFKEIFAVQCRSGVYFSYSGKIKGDGQGNATRSTWQPVDNGVSDFTDWHGIACHGFGLKVDNTSQETNSYTKVGTIGNMYAYGCRDYFFQDYQTGSGSVDTIQLLKGGHNMSSWGNQVGLYGQYSGSTRYISKINTIQCEAANSAIKTNSSASDITIDTLNSVVPNFRSDLGGGYDENKPIRFFDSQMTKSIDHRFGKLQINSGSCEGNIQISSTAGDLKSANLSLADSPYVALPIGSQTGEAWYYAKNFDNVSGSNRSYYKENYIANETTTVHTTGGTAWRFQSNLVSTPLGFEACKVAVNANSVVTVSLYVYTSSSNAYAGIRIKNNSLLGINNDVTAYDNTGNSTWVQCSATCTPTAQGILVIEIESYKTDGVSTHTIIVDDLSVQQA